MIQQGIAKILKFPRGGIFFGGGGHPVYNVKERIMRTATAANKGATLVAVTTLQLRVLRRLLRRYLSSLYFKR